MGTKYSSNSATGYNSTPPADDGTVSEANKVKWSTVKTKLADPVKDLADTINSELATHFNNGPNAYVSNQTLGATNYNTINQVSGSGVTLTLTDATTLGAGWYCDIVNTDTSNTVSLARATASDMINETSADVTIQPLSHLRAIVNAAANGFLVTNASRITKDFKTAENYTHSGTVTMSGKSIIEANASIAAHATTMDPWSLGNYVTLTGTAVTFTALANAPQAGAEVELYMNAAHIFTDGAVFEVDGDANWTAEAGDRVLLRAKSTTVFTVHPRKKTGSAVKGILQIVNTQTGARATGTTAIPADDTIPQNTEGTEFMTLAITPKSSTSKLKIDVVWCGAGASEPLMVALFQDSTADALAAGSVQITPANRPQNVVFTHYMTSGTTSATTFKVRAGQAAGTTIEFNGFDSGARLGGTWASSITITEIAA